MHLLDKFDALNGRVIMNFRSLRMFVATAESGGLARASALLNLSQPAASRQIHALEAEFGVPLFHRVGRKLQLTSAGDDLLQRSRRLLADADLLTEQARALRDGRKGTLRVSATPQIMTALLTSFLPRYRRRHSGIEVQLIERSGGRQWNQLERGETDLTFMPPGHAGFPGRLLFPIYTLAVLPKSHRLARRAIIDIVEIVEEPLLLLRPKFGSRASFDAACEVAQVVPRVLLECTAAHTLIDLTSVGYGVAIVPSIVAIQHQNLRAVPLVLRGASIGHWEAVCWDLRRPVQPFVETFVNELGAHVRRGFPGQKLVGRAPSLPKPGGPFR
jgi:LysR family cyn operon transcriptional activator